MAQWNVLPEDLKVTSKQNREKYKKRIREKTRQLSIFPPKMNKLPKIASNLNIWAIGYSVDPKTFQIALNGYRKDETVFVLS